MTSITYLLIKLINKQQKIIRKLKEMILQLSDIQGWADTLNADAVAITSKIQLLLAQIAEKFIKKGTLVYVEGKIRTRSYDDQSGVKRYVTEIIADSIELLSRKGGGEFEQNTPRVEPNQQISNQPDLNESSEIDDLPF